MNKTVSVATDNITIACNRIKNKCEKLTYQEHSDEQRVQILMDILDEKITIEVEIRLALRSLAPFDT